MNIVDTNNTNINEYYLPNYMKLDKDYKLLYIDPNSVEKKWVIAPNLRQAEYKSGYGKLLWVLCPLYKKYKIGYKYVPRNSLITIKSYLEKFHPNKINLLEGETLESIKYIWIYDNGYFSYYIKQQKKNLERNCTNGLSCKGRLDGSCPYNHYININNTAHLCSNDILINNDNKIVMKRQTECTNINCEYDHSINRVEMVNFLKNEYSHICSIFDKDETGLDLTDYDLTDSDLTDDEELNEIYNSSLESYETDEELYSDNIIEFAENNRSIFMKNILSREKQELKDIINYILIV